MEITSSLLIALIAHTLQRTRTHTNSKFTVCIFFCLYFSDLNPLNCHPPYTPLIYTVLYYRKRNDQLLFLEYLHVMHRTVVVVLQNTTIIRTNQTPPRQFYFSCLLKASARYSPSRQHIGRYVVVCLQCIIIYSLLNYCVL